MKSQFGQSSQALSLWESNDILGAILGLKTVREADSVLFDCSDISSRVGEGWVKVYRLGRPPLT